MLKPRMRLHEASRLRTPLPSKGLVLYTHTLCPYAQRVWLTLLYKVSRCSRLLAVQAA
jgi:hypothetical protein